MVHDKTDTSSLRVGHSKVGDYGRSPEGLRRTGDLKGVMVSTVEGGTRTHSLVRGG